jgi:uncharacterized protein (DUF1697 family)
MQSHAAFLRGVNLGANRKASGADLREALEGAGFGDVATFRNSGNVVFSGKGAATKLTAQVEECLAAKLGFDVKVFLRTAAQVRAIAEREPFPADLVEASAGKLQVSLLDERPAKRAQEEVLALATDEDRLVFGDRELYWLPSGGIRDSALDQKTIERVLGPATMRTMGTIELMAAKYFS